jgi:uncharacterized membrane protein
MPQEPPSTARLEAFSDGVIAVIITIMVLELKVPQKDGIAGLYAILPTLFVYVLSFSFTGIYWINHQHLLARIQSADALILYSNLCFLLFLSLLPFFTAYVIEKKMAPFAVALYAVSMLVTGFSFLLLRLAIHRSLLRSSDLHTEDQLVRGKHLASLALYLIATPLAYFHAGLSLILIGLVTVVWVVPTWVVKKKEA